MGWEVEDVPDLCMGRVRRCTPI